MSYVQAIKENNSTNMDQTDTSLLMPMADFVERGVWMSSFSNLKKQNNHLLTVIKKRKTLLPTSKLITDLLKSDSTSSASETRTLTRDLRKREQKEADKDQAKKR